MPVKPQTPYAVTRDGLLPEQYKYILDPLDRLTFAAAHIFGQLAAPMAHSTAALFANVDRSRVRKCDQCVLHFHDTSKKGTRRWRSMQLCGNRLKVAAYATRQRMRAR